MQGNKDVCFLMAEPCVTLQKLAGKTIITNNDQNNTHVHENDYPKNTYVYRKGPQVNANSDQNNLHVD